MASTIMCTFLDPFIVVFKLMDENHACSIKIQYLVKLIDLLSFLVFELFISYPTME